MAKLQFEPYSLSLNHLVGFERAHVLGLRRPMCLYSRQLVIQHCTWLSSHFVQLLSCFFSIKNAQRLTTVMFLGDFFAHKSDYEMGKAFASQYCPALNAPRMSTLHLLKFFFLFYRLMSFQLLIRKHTPWMWWNAIPSLEIACLLSSMCSTPLSHVSLLLAILRSKGGSRGTGSICCLLGGSPREDSASSPSSSRAGDLSKWVSTQAPRNTGGISKLANTQAPARPTGVASCKEERHAQLLKVPCPLPIILMCSCG